MFQLIKIQLEIFAPLQALFPSLKIDIFCRIVPLFLLRIWNESSWKNLYPLQTLFLTLKIAIFWRIAPQLGRAEFFV